MSTLARVVVGTLAMLGVATAEPPVKPEAPRPPAQVEAMGRAVAGTWTCAGTETGPDGVAVKMTATVQAKVELDRWWIHDTVDVNGKSAFRMFAFTTYDESAKKWRRVSIDNGGHQYVGTSDGMRDRKVDWHLTFAGPTGAGQLREHVDLTDPKILKNWGEMSRDKGKTWKAIFEMTCRK